MRDARVALAVGLALTAVAVSVVLFRSPQVIAGSNAIGSLPRALQSVPGSGSACQANETLPAGTSAITLSLEATAGPHVAVSVRSGNITVTHGESTNGWTGAAVTIPVEPVDRVVRDATVCFSFAGANERVLLLGASTSTERAATSSGSALPGRVGVEYLRSGSSSWWSLAHAIARRMGLGRAWPGGWVVLLVAALMACAIAIASWLIVRGSP
jgi:hypothetical protein